MKMTMVGGEPLQAKLRFARVAGPEAVVATLYQEAQIVMSAAQQDYVPVDTGALRASGFVEPPTPTHTGASITLGFGGPSAPYAVYVHEDLTKRHPVGQAKYLEIPLRARIQGMKAVLAQRVRDVLRQSTQRMGRMLGNIQAGRVLHWGMPLFRGE